MGDLYRSRWYRISLQQYTHSEINRFIVIYFRPFHVNGHQLIVEYCTIVDYNKEKIKGSFYEPELQKASQEMFRIQKVIRRKGNKSLVKWLGYPDSFNSWVDNDELVKLQINLGYKINGLCYFNRWSFITKQTTFKL